MWLRIGEIVLILGKPSNLKRKSLDLSLCPDAPEGAGNWVVKQLPNRFAALNEDAPPFTEEIIGDIYKLSSNYGKCEVILYSQDHNASFGNLEHSNIVALIKLWMERFKVLSDTQESNIHFFLKIEEKKLEYPKPIRMDRSMLFLIFRQELNGNLMLSKITNWRKIDV